MLNFFIIFYLIFFIILYYFFTLNNDIYILENIFNIDNIQKILNDNYLKYDEYNDKYFYILHKDENQELYKIIYENNKLKNFIKKNFNKKLNYPSFPIEYRLYKKGSKGMNWHQDKKILNKKYLECILVLHNNTNSYFRYYRNYKFHKYYQKSNSLILLYPNDIIHSIEPFRYGTKKILKFVIELE
jgi:hypothetical protein